MSRRVASIQRHPLKSHGRETLGTVLLTEGRTLPWDRHWAVAHDAAKLTAGEWGPCANFSRGSKAPNLMAISARFDEAARCLTLSHPDKPDLTFRPDDDADLPRFLDWVRPLCPPDRAQPVRIFNAAERGLTDTDYASVSILSCASNRALGEHVGLDLSMRRWRGNFWIEGLRPFEERSWIGRRLRLGKAIVKVVEPIARCLATSANPATGMRDVDTLGALKGLVGDQDFGVYATVVEGGTVSTGDLLEPLP
ncbi:MAG: MOSC domain-containing protein [Paracoccaceae bacterium]